MKQNFLLNSLCALAFIFAGCTHHDDPEETYTPDDQNLPGDVVTDPVESGYYKLFILNEGAMGNNNASVDFFRFNDGKYVTNAYEKMNPTSVLALGDIGNDMQFFLNSAWCVMNGSGLVQVFSALDEKEIVSIAVPSPRKIYMDWNIGYAFVTSYAGATYGDDRTGALYRISLSSQAPTANDPIELGYQPEGLTVCNGMIYVVCSGGFHAGYDNRIFVVDPYAWEVVSTIEGPANMNSIITDGSGRLWVAAAGDYYSVHSGLYCINPSLGTVSQPGTVSDVRVSYMHYDPNSECIYALGTDDEWVWDAKQEFNLYKVDLLSGAVQKFPLSVNPDAASITYPYGVTRNVLTGDLYITDAGDWTSPGEVWCFSSDLSKTRWHHSAGIGAGHPMLYAIQYAY